DRQTPCADSRRPLGDGGEERPPRHVRREREHRAQAEREAIARLKPSRSGCLEGEPFRLAEATLKGSACICWRPASSDSATLKGSPYRSNQGERQERPAQPSRTRKDHKDR